MRIIIPGQTIGIIGGGQLGKMLGMAAITMGYRVAILDSNKDAPAFSVAHEQIIGTLDDRAAIEKLVQIADVVTYEFENIDATIVAELATSYKNIPQGSFPLFVSQNRQREKNSLVEAGLTVAPFVILTDVEKELPAAVTKLGYPLVIKTQEGGYDGKGQVVVKNEGDLAKVTELFDYPCVAEKFVDFTYECSIIGVRSQDGKIKHFPMAVNTHKNNILWQTITKENLISPVAQTKAVEMLENYLEKHNIIGILTMELFINGDEVIVNEIAPRPHNSGHYTIEGCRTSQFEQAIRAICGLPLANNDLIAPTVMYNILGQHKAALFRYLPQMSTNAHLHLYGKKDYVNNRKMGHLTFINPTNEELIFFEQQVLVD
jgi:phosphoribosylaminoimidazole carboxylase, PurK protein